MGSPSDSNEQLIVKPFLTDKMAGQLLKKLYGMEASQTKELPSFCDQNFHVRVAGPGGAEDGGREVVLKLSNTEDSLYQRGCYEEIIGVLSYLQRVGSSGMYPTPVRNLQGEYLSLQTFYRGKFQEGSQRVTAIYSRSFRSLDEVVADYQSLSFVTEVLHIFPF